MFVSSVYHPTRENAIRETGRRTGKRGKGGRAAWRISAQKRKKSRRGHNVRGGVVTQRGFEPPDPLLKRQLLCLLSY